MEDLDGRMMLILFLIRMEDVWLKGKDDVDFVREMTMVMSAMLKVTILSSNLCSTKLVILISKFQD